MFSTSLNGAWPAETAAVKKAMGLCMVLVLLCGASDGFAQSRAKAFSSGAHAGDATSTAPAMDAKTDPQPISDDGRAIGPIADRVVACTACHGKQGRATNQGYFPRIAGKPAGYLYHQLLNIRDGRRHYAPMALLLDHLTDDYLREIADYFAGLDIAYPPPQTTGAPLALLAHGESLVLKGDASRRIPACVQCHGAAMTGVRPDIPGLLGLPRDYLNAQLGAWKTGERHAQAPDCMGQVAGQLTSEDVEAVSTWLSSQALPADTHPAAALPAKLPLACGSVALSGGGL
jgi:cytochrome c553